MCIPRTLHVQGWRVECWDHIKEYLNDLENIEKGWKGGGLWGVYIIYKKLSPGPPHKWNDFFGVVWWGGGARDKKLEVSSNK